MRWMNRAGRADGRMMRATGNSGPGLLPADFFKKISHSYHSAINQKTVQAQYFISIAGRTLCLSFAGRELERLVMPALAHLISSPPSAPSLTIFIWDSKSTGAAMPEILFAPKNASSKEGYLISAENFRACFSLGEPSTQYSLLDTSRREAFFWVPHSGHISCADYAAPLRIIFSWWLKSQGLQMLHAAAVGTPQGGVLLAGKGGSGKSSTALACLESDLGYAADDYVVLSPTTPYKVYSLYNSGRWDRHGAQSFSYPMSKWVGPLSCEKEKAHLFVMEIFPEKILKEFPLLALLFPEIQKENVRARFSRIAPAEALRRLAPSTLLQLAESRGEGFDAMADLVKRIPAYSFGLSTDKAVLPRLISEFISEQLKESKCD